METRLTDEEVGILHIVLSRIDPQAKFFNVPSLYAPTLQEKYPFEVNGVRNGLYDKALKDFTQRGVFAHVTSWLLQDEYAVKSEPPSSIYIDLKLTKRGEILWAYGNVYDFMTASASSTIYETEKRVPDIIARAFPYGEFTIRPELPKVQVINFNFLSPDEEGENAKLKKALDLKEQIKTLHKVGLLDEEVMQYLVSNGFAINRHDIKVDGVLYRQLTDKGRELKDCGSIEEYNQRIEQRKKEIEDEYLWRKETSEMQHELAKTQNQLSLNQIETNELSKITNVYIAIFTFFATEFSCYEFLLNYISDLNVYKATIINVSLISLMVLGIIGYQRIETIRQKPNNRE